MHAAPSPGLSVAPLLRPQEGQEAKGGGREGGAFVDGVPQVQSGATPCPCSFSSLCATCLPSLLPFRRQERRAEVPLHVLGQGLQDLYNNGGDDHSEPIYTWVSLCLITPRGHAPREQQGPSCRVQTSGSVFPRWHSWEG